MSMTINTLNRTKRGLRRSGAAVSVWLPTNQGPAGFRGLVGRARVAEARRLVRAEKDYVAAEQVIAPLLAAPASGSSPVSSGAWALVAEVRERQGDRSGALEAARCAVAQAPVALEALLVQQRLLAGTPEGGDALRGLVDHRPRNRRQLEQVLVALRTGSVPDVERYRANLERWGLHGYDEYLAEVTSEITLVAADDLTAGVADVTAYLRWPVPVVARGLDRRRSWDLLADWAGAHPLPDGAPLVHVKAAATELRKAAARALTAGYTSAAATLAGHALALRPDDSFAQETWANAADQLAVVRDGWAVARRSPQPALATRPGAVLSVLAQSLPHTSGGYATRTHGVLTGLRELGYDVRAVTRPGFPYDRWPKGDDRVVPAEDQLDGVPYHRLLTEARVYPQYPLRGYVDRYADALVGHARAHGAALIHASSFHVNGLAAQAAAARLGLPFVYEMRGLEELMKVSRDPAFEGSDRYRFLEHLETTIALAADRVFVITAALRDLMVARGVPESKLVVLPNGVHASRFEPRARDRDLEARLGLAGKTVIGYAGGLVDYEGLELLLTAVSLLQARRSDFHLVVVGDGHHQATIRRAAAELSLSDVVTFTGRVPHEEVASYLSLFDITPFPRLPLPVCEAISPIKPFESMAMGKAVVVSSVAALTEIVTDGVTGLVFEKGCAAELARVLERLLDSPELRERLGAAARSWVLAERDWSSIVRTVDATYQELVG